MEAHLAVRQLSECQLQQELSSVHLVGFHPVILHWNHFLDPHWPSVLLFHHPLPLCLEWLCHSKAELGWDCCTMLWARHLCHILSKSCCQCLRSASISNAFPCVFSWITVSFWSYIIDLHLVEDIDEAQEIFRINLDAGLLDALSPETSSRSTLNGSESMKNDFQQDWSYICVFTVLHVHPYKIQDFEAWSLRIGKI